MADVCRRCGAPRNGQGECDYCEPAPGSDETVLRRAVPPPPAPKAVPPDASPKRPPPEQRRPRRPPVGLVLGGVLILVVGALGVVLLRPWDDSDSVAAGASRAPSSTVGRSDRPDSSSATSTAEPSLLAPCDREPGVRPVASAASGEAADVRLAFQAACSGGQYVDGDRVHVGLRQEDGQVLADAVYDFSAAPLWLPGDRSVERTLTFRAVQVPSEELGDLIDHDAVVAQYDESAADDDVEGQAATPVQPEAETTYPPEGSYESDSTREDRLSLASLRETAAEDRPAAAADLEGWWVPQLSSKALGTVADGRSFRYADIYDEHSRLRDAYPDVRLLDSGDWRSFANPGFWVTVAGLRFGEPGEANAWCDQQGFGVDDCLAKRILVDGPPEHTTVTRK